MRPSIVFGSLCIAFSLLIVGCGGGNIEKEIDALRADIPNIKDAASFKTFMEKANSIGEKIKSAPDDKKMDLAKKLAGVIVEGTTKAGPGAILPGGMPGF